MSIYQSMKRHTLDWNDYAGHSYDSLLGRSPKDRKRLLGVVFPAENRLVFRVEIGPKVLLETADFRKAFEFYNKTS